VLKNALLTGFDPEQPYNPDFRLAADPQKAAIRSNTAYDVLANLDCLCVWVN